MSIAIPIKIINLPPDPELFLPLPLLIALH